MPIAPGTRIGPYAVTVPIGVGGMGEVYQATDTNLKRQVAIKVLPDAVASDVDRLARFQREAEVLASLNHPNIAAIYGLERAGGMTALVMELVEGPTLADRIEAGPISFDQVLPIARQIAEALEAAHEQGIVHRDLKPANIKVRPDGMVKVLDFGLAKAMEPTGAMSANQSLSPTITTPAMTQAGLILGTAAYMSPEQARGAPVDARADVWAFGCVFYEMLTGRAVFDGKTVSDVLAGVLRADPDWQRLPGAIHPRLRLMLERCLARDVRNRYQGIADARVDIEVAIEDPTGATIAEDSTRHDPRGHSPARRWATIGAAAGVGVLATALATLVLLPDRDGLDSAAIRFALPPPDGTLLDASLEGVPFAVSPDGLTVVFSARTTNGRSQLFVRPLDSDRAQPLQGTDGAESPFWSPNSEWVAFYAGGNLRKVRRGGGDPQTIAATRSTGAGGSAWSTDDTILFKTGRFGSSWVGVSAQGGPISDATRLADGETGHVWAAFLQDGRRFLHRVDGARPGIYLTSLDGDPPRLLREDADVSERGLALVQGFVLFARHGALVAQRFDEERLELLGAEFRLVDEIPVSAGSWDPWSVSGTGVLVYWRNGWGFDSVLRWHARTGTAQGRLGASTRYSGIALSPDGGRLSFSRYVDGRRDLWVRDLSRGTETRLTSDGDSAYPVWSPDGSQVAHFAWEPGSVPDVYVTSATRGSGGDTSRLTSPSQAVDVPGTWTSDGSTIVYTALNPDGQSDLRRVEVAGGTEEALTINGAFNESYPRLSPDGNWLAYVTDATGRREVWVARFPSGDDPVPISSGGGRMPEWRADGRELYYLSEAQELVVVPVTLTGSGVIAGTPSVLFPIPDLVPTSDVDSSRAVYAPAADGSRFLVNVLAPGASQPPLQVIVNWPALLDE